MHIYTYIYTHICIYLFIYFDWDVKAERSTYDLSLCTDLTGVIPEEEYEQEMYDDVGAPVQPIDEDIYEELPGLTSHYFII